jgi:hypothetical protein
MAFTSRPQTRTRLKPKLYQSGVSEFARGEGPGQREGRRRRGGRRFGQGQEKRKGHCAWAPCEVKPLGVVKEPCDAHAAFDFNCYLVGGSRG